MTRTLERRITTQAHAAALAFVRSLIERDIDRAITATYSGAAR